MDYTFTTGAACIFSPFTMKVLFTIGLLAGSLAAAAQVPVATAPASTTTAPARVLTPAEIRQKERIAKVLEEERKLRDEIARAQREYQAKQANKDRQRREKEQQKQTPAATAAVTPAPVVTTEPVREKPEKSKSAPTPKTAPKSAEPQPARQATVTPAEPPKPDARAEREQTRQQEALDRERQKQQEQADRDARKAVRDAAQTKARADKVAAKVAPDTVARRLLTKEFLPKGHLFEPILLDPLEAQTYASVLPAFRTDGRNYPGTIVPFAFGFCKPFYRWTKSPERASELSLDVASYTQFEVYHDDVKNTQKRQLINTDYKFSVIYNLRRGVNNWRFRFYHISSHLGDDYLFRNAIQSYSYNSVNYELVDATYSRVVRNVRYYGGVGFVLRKAEERKLLAGHAGFYYRSPAPMRSVRMVGGLDAKVWQQTDFRPGLKAAVGIEVGKVTNPLTFVLEGYTGFRPNSQYENQHVRWLGIGVYFNPI